MIPNEHGSICLNGLISNDDDDDDNDNDENLTDAYFFFESLKLFTIFIYHTNYLVTVEKLRKNITKTK